jgi:hypothetical protein
VWAVYAVSKSEICSERFSESPLVGQLGDTGTERRTILERTLKEVGHALEVWTRLKSLHIGSSCGLS